MNQLPIKVIHDIRLLELYHDPARYLPESWQGTALDVLEIETCAPRYKLLIVLNKGWIDDRRLRSFAVWCARRTLARTGDQDPRGAVACEVAERFANHVATKAELTATRNAIWDATLSRDWEEAWSNTLYAPQAAAWAAAWAVVKDTAWEAAENASWSDAWTATWELLREIAYPPSAASVEQWDVAYDINKGKQVAYLRQLLEENC